MKIYWEGHAAYDEKHNFLVIIHQMQNNSLYGFLNYPGNELDYRQMKINELTLEKAKEKIEMIFNGINDISEIENLLPNPGENDELPSKFLKFLAEFAIHRP